MRSPRTFAKANILRTPQHLGGGFTLIELLVVVLIIAILAAVALPQYTKAVEKARLTEAMLNVKALAGSVERYILANDSNPSSFDQLDITIPNLSFSGNLGNSGKYMYQLGNNDAIGCRDTSGSYASGFRPLCAGYWFRDDPRAGMEIITAGSLICGVYLADSKAEQNKGLCKSLGGTDAKSATVSNFIHYKIN
ncbi:prepilin-type N-terminal cleavage/methylation domain-containing protein [Parelusimicrobium proximum]|uniref:type IV pilin protein n=1 Tax=Parelusimicrobium proximum TaxID=3228953 RepID=UPI003D171DB5